MKIIQTCFFSWEALAAKLVVQMWKFSDCLDSVLDASVYPPSGSDMHTAIRMADRRPLVFGSGKVDFGEVVPDCLAAESVQL